MKSLDFVFLALLSTVTLGLVFVPKTIKKLLLLATTSLVLLAVFQFIQHGFYWQYIPAYFLVALLLLTTFLKRTGSDKLGMLSRVGLGLLLVASLTPWAVLLPVPTLNKPQGHYAVGTKVFRWVDADRAERITKDTTDKRNVIVQAWYPAETSLKGAHSSYMDGLGRLPEKIGVIPSFLFKHYDEIDTHGIPNAAVAKAQKKWPVILFLTGYGAPRAFYTSLAVGLASFGYVVLALDHPYEALFTELANGQIVAPIEDFSAFESRLNYMEDRLNLRVADVRFVVNEVSKRASSMDQFFSSLDLSRIGATGHSFGGATSGAAMAHDSRIKAAANIDGTLYGELPKTTGARPFMVIESNKSDGSNYERYEKGNHLLFKQFGSSHRYELPEADHYSFTDVPLLLSPPARFLAGQLVPFGQIPQQTHTATVGLLHAFFDHALNGKPSTVDSVASRIEGILRKPVE